MLWYVAGCCDLEWGGLSVSFPFPLMSLQVMASKYMNDEGEMEALTNTEWAEIGTPVGQVQSSLVISSKF